MLIAILALGSRGDVQPYIALAKALQQAGHKIRLLTHPNFKSLAQAHGLDYREMRGDIQAITESPEMRELIEKGNFLAIHRKTAEEGKRAALHWAEDGLNAAQGADLLLGGLGGLNIGISLAEKLNIPYLQAYLVPFAPTSAFPGALFPSSLPRFLNRLSHHLTRFILWQGFKSADSAARTQVLGLSASPPTSPYRSKHTQGLPILYGVSPSVIPSPPDWGSEHHLTGYWFLDSEDSWTPPQALIDFLEAGPPPVYIGFGSMSSRKPEETAQLVLQALKLSQQRAILLSGWSGMQIQHLPESVYVIDSIPHAWLFPRVSAVVHHGGAGTTAAGLRAGLPSILIPFFGDQPFWGHRIQALGVGPAPIPRKKLTAERLAAALQHVSTDSEMRKRAAELGKKIQSEDGLARAAQVISDVKTE